MPSFEEWDADERGFGGDARIDQLIQYPRKSAESVEIRVLFVDAKKSADE